MKISIITTTYNSEATLEATIQSVVGQSYKDIEYIIIDGQSSDATLQIIEKYRGYISKVVSEEDDGLYHALNKGIELSTGDYVSFLPSDDKLYKNTTIAEIVENISGSNPDFIWGDIVFQDSSNKITRYYRGNLPPQLGFRMGIMPPHSSLFVKRSIHQRFDDYDTRYKIAADYEFTLRLLVKHKVTYKYIPSVLISMTPGGVSNESFWSVIRLNFEILYSHYKNGLNINPLSLLFKVPIRLNESKNILQKIETSMEKDGKS